MKIIDKVANTVELEEVKFGQTFRHRGEIFIATDNGTYLNLSNGILNDYEDLMYIDSGEVEIVECEVRVL